MIVKNEAHVIQRCLRSVKPFIDSYSISDTGSTDNTMDLIREELAGIPGVLTSDPWEDFSANRNLASSRCAGDHIISLDADETLVPTGGPLVLDPEFDAFSIRYNIPDLDYWMVKLVRNDPRWKFVNKVHEALTFDGTPKYGRIENFRFQNFFDSHRNKLGDKFERDLEVLETDAQTPRNVFYQARTLADMGKKEEAIKKFYERAEMGGWDQEVYYSLWKAADLMGSEGNFWEIAGALYKAYSYRPTRYEALAKLCKLLNQRKRYDESYRLSAVNPEPTTDYLFADKQTEWKLYFEHAHAAERLGLTDESEEYFRRVSEIASHWELPALFIDLSQAYYQAEHWERCIETSRSALELEPGYAKAFNNICAAYNKMGLFEEGRKAGEESVRLDPNNKLAKNNLAWSIRELEKNK
jgi:tetratricopeptide (TPR) repeat protein